MRVDLTRAVTIDDAASAARAFAVWWKDQILLLIPGKFRSWLDRSFDCWTLAVSKSEWVLSSASPDAPELKFNTNDAIETLNELIASQAPQCLTCRIDVQLAEADVLIRRLRLPAATQTHLRSVIKLQLGRLSPFHAPDVVFDCRSLGPTGDQEIEVEVGLIPKEKLLDYETRLGAAGLIARKYFIKHTSLSFPPPHKQFGAQEKLQFGLAAAVLFLWSAAIVLTPVMRAWELSGFSHKVFQLRVPAQEAAAMQDSVMRIQGPVHAAAQMFNRPSPLDILKSLTQLLPDDIYVHDLTIVGDTVRMNVETTNLPMLASLLHQSKEFRVSYLGSTSAPIGARTRIDVELLAKSVSARMMR